MSKISITQPHPLRHIYNYLYNIVSVSLVLVGSPGVLELHEGEGRPAAPVLQIYVSDAAVLVKHVLHVLGADVRRQVTHIDPTVVVPRGSSDYLGHAVGLGPRCYVSLVKE